MRWLVKKKSIAITSGILIAITAASFIVYFIPQKQNASFVILDFKSHIESVENRYGAIDNEIEDDFQNMQNGSITPQDYVTRAEASTLQVNALLIELVESNAPQEWHESYLNLIESLKKYNSYLRETIVIANKIKDESGQDIQKDLETINFLKNEAESLANKSNETKP